MATESGVSLSNTLPQFWQGTAFTSFTVAPALMVTVAGAAVP